MTVEIRLDGRFIVNRATVHDLLGQKLSLPSWYGRNLDALYDVLSAYPENLRITLVNGDVMAETLGNYANALIKTFLDASRANPNLDFSVSNEII